MKYRNIFFDYDGVISDSFNIKTEAFYKIYLPFGEDVASKAKNHHIQHGGMSRFEKFKHYHKNFLNIDLTEKEIEKLAGQFSELVLQGVIDTPFVNGFTTFIEKHATDMDYWIISGTPDAEIKYIAEKKGVANWFKGIHGSPVNKDEWVKTILKKFNLEPAKIIFLGDATADHDASLNNGLGFALREHRDNLELFENYAGVRFKDFIELEENINA